MTGFGFGLDATWPCHGLVDGLSLQRPVFDPVPIHLRFVVDDVSLRQGVLQVIHFSVFYIISPVLDTYIRPNTTHKKDNRASLVTIKKTVLLWITGSNGLLRCFNSACRKFIILAALSVGKI